ncbi:putative transmembrane protein, partial [Trifolium medium]|nr:putative transmembrane protein [Trifolium medium]
MEFGQEVKQNLGTEEEIRNQEESRVCEQTVKSRGNLELEVDGSNDSQKPVDETCEVLLDGRGFQDEPIGDLLIIETHVLSTLVAEDSSEVIDDKTDTHEKFKEEPEPTIFQKGVLDNNMDTVCNEAESCELGR